MGEKEKTGWCVFRFHFGLQFRCCAECFLRNCNEDLGPVPLTLAHISVAWENLAALL